VYEPQAFTVDVFEELGVIVRFNVSVWQPLTEVYVPLDVYV
jgi:hypothetical protein